MLTASVLVCLLSLLWFSSVLNLIIFLCTSGWLHFSPFTKIRTRKSYHQVSELKRLLILPKAIQKMTLTMSSL